MTNQGEGKGAGKEAEQGEQGSNCGLKAQRGSGSGKHFEAILYCQTREQPQKLPAD